MLPKNKKIEGNVIALIILPKNVPWEAFISLYNILSVMKHSYLFLLMVCLIGGFVLLSGCTTYPGTPNATPTLTPVPTMIGDPSSCTKDAECVPAQCCHPESCNSQVPAGLQCRQVHRSMPGPSRLWCRPLPLHRREMPGDPGGPVLTGQATLIIAVKDAPKIKDGGTITRLLLTISEVSVQKAAPNQTIAQSDEEVSATESEETDTAGWITVMNEPQTVDLLQFVNVSKVLWPEDPGRRHLYPDPPEDRFGDDHGR